MPVTYSLIENNRVQRLVIAEPWDVVADLLPAIRAIAADLDHATKVMHIMVDLRQAHRLPIGVIGQIRHEMRPGHSMRGQAILVGGSFVFKEIFRFMAARVKYAGLRFFETEDEALTYLRKLLTEEEQVRSATE